ncbi:PIN domain-containing protein [Candidatus Woesebacteria bacterium]|nr:PIN domain-containing protein [Candidatus Woesebacteria bacterium]QQG47574.1 MAG: PIN domain-containing protein [Candidatus Woesebacteria bacterium]
MKTPIVADSSSLVSLASITDSNHKRAVQISTDIQKENFQLIIPGEVLTETTNTIGKKVGHQEAFGTATQIMKSSEIAVIDTNQNIRKNALQKFQNQPESVSFTDCLVMSFADEYKTKLIFAFDKAFKKNGYIRFGVDNQD